MSELLTDHPAPGIRRLLINRPEARNAINAAVREALHTALIAVRDEPTIRAVIIGGAGGFFSAGGDLPSMVGISPEAALARMADGHKIVSLLWRFPKPVIAAIERAAAGAGAGIAMLADRIIIGNTATLLFPFLRLGLVPDWGLIQTISRRAGATQAQRFFLDGKPINAETAIAHNMADLNVEDDAVMTHAIKQAELLAALPSQAFVRLKQLLRHDLNNDPLNLVQEAQAQTACLTGPEFIEGYAAFKEKRAPNFAQTENR
jgi:2-(1,2-epoxy-1,2-dihydrophenyl)acetyl-CoA isomerase